MPLEAGIDITKDAVLRRVTQEQIFEAYLGLPVDTGTAYINPLRLDKRPSCKYYYNALGKLYFHDWGKYHWDCFAMVQFKYGGCSFAEALKIIIKDFKLNGLSATNAVVEFTPTPKSRDQISIKVRDWNPNDIAYWQQYGIVVDLLKYYKVYPCSSAWVNGEHYTFHSNDPCYAYWFGQGKFKLYFPKRSYNRFYQNIQKGDNFLQGYQQRNKDADYIVITKSYKDVMCMYNFGINSVAVISEYHLVEKEFYDQIKAQYNHVFTLFDNDLAGRTLTNKYRRAYNTIPLIFPWTLEKDFSDNFKKYGPQKLITIIEWIKENMN